jgi:hypothetical protein
VVVSLFSSLPYGVRLCECDTKGGLLHGSQGKPEVFEESYNTLSRLQAVACMETVRFFFYFYILIVFLIFYLLLRTKKLIFSIFRKNI